MGKSRKNGKKVALPPPARRAFAARLKAHRIAGGWETAKEFAEAAHVEHGTYTRWERAETEPNVTTLLRLCDKLEVTPNDLLLTPRQKARAIQRPAQPQLRRIST